MVRNKAKQAGDADNDTLIEGERIELVLVGVGLPQIELRQVIGTQFGDEGDHGAGIERDAVNVGIGAVLPLWRIARRRRNVDDARLAEIRPNQAGTDHPVMRRHDQPVDLLVAVIGEREDRPIRSRLPRAYFDAPDNAVVARRRGHLDAVAGGMLDLDRVGQVDRAGVGADVDGFDRVCGRYPDEGREGERQKGAAHSAKRCGAQSFGAESVGAQIGGAQKCQENPSEAASRRRSRHPHRSRKGVPTGLCAEFATA